MKHRELSLGWTYCMRTKGKVSNARLMLPAADEVVGADREHDVDCADCRKGMNARAALSDKRGVAKKF